MPRCKRCGRWLPQFGRASAVVAGLLAVFVLVAALLWAILQIVGFNTRGSNTLDAVYHSPSHLQPTISDPATEILPANRS